MTKRQIALIVGAISVIAVGAIALGFRAVDERPDPATADGLLVISVAEAINVRAAGATEEAPLAVAGYYSTGPVGSCPMRLGPDGRGRQPAVLERFCHEFEILAALPEARVVVVVVDIDVAADFNSIAARPRELNGHALPVSLLFNSVREGLHNHLPPTPFGDPIWVPVPVVFVGHFADHRANECLPEEQEDCLGVFAVDHVAWANGVTIAPSIQPDPGRGPATSTIEAVERATDAAVGGANVFLSISAFAGRIYPASSLGLPLCPTSPPYGTSTS